MADLLKDSSDIGIEAGEAQQFDGPSISLRHVAVNRLRRHLTRTITQPRGLYESIIDAYGPISEPAVLQSEASQVDEAYKSLHASCSSDTETCSSYEDCQESHPDSAHDPKDGPESRGGKSRSRRRHESQKRGEIQKRSDEEWAKSILARRTGYGCLQRNQVSKYITQLESTVGELQLEIFNLSPQVILLDHHRSMLQEENDKLKRMIAELSRYQIFKRDQNSALKKDLRSLKSQRADYLELADRREQDTVPSPKEGLHIRRGDGGEATADLASVQQPSQITLPSDKLTSKKELEGFLPHIPNESSREQEKTASLMRSSPSSQREPQADVKVSRQLSLVKWPSSLYRSVSAIRKDVLDVAIEEPTVK